MITLQTNRDIGIVIGDSGAYCFSALEETVMAFGIKDVREFKSYAEAKVALAYGQITKLIIEQTNSEYKEISNDKNNFISENLSCEVTEVYAIDKQGKFTATLLRAENVGKCSMNGKLTFIIGQHNAEYYELEIIGARTSEMINLTIFTMN